LGLLAQGPRHGYELHSAFIALAGGADQWDVKPPQIYSTLARLEEAGLVERDVEGAVPLAGELAARGVERDLVDPGPDLAPGRVVRRGPEPHPREGLLQPLLGEGAASAAEAEEDGEDGPLVPPVEGGERVRVAPGHPFEDGHVESIQEQSGPACLLTRESLQIFFHCRVRNYLSG